MLQTTLDSSARIYQNLPAAAKPAFFQLVHHPVQASLILQNMWISAGINNLRASQARISANNYKDAVEKLFDDDCSGRVLTTFGILPTWGSRLGRSCVEFERLCVATEGSCFRN